MLCTLQHRKCEKLKSGTILIGMASGLKFSIPFEIKGDLAVRKSRLKYWLSQDVRTEKYKRNFLFFISDFF